jgi:hypothetical protein
LEKEILTVWKGKFWQLEKENFDSLEISRDTQFGNHCIKQYIGMLDKLSEMKALYRDYPRAFWLHRCSEKPLTMLMGSRIILPHASLFNQKIPTSLSRDRIWSHVYSLIQKLISGNHVYYTIFSTLLYRSSFLFNVIGKIWSFRRK